MTTAPPACPVASAVESPVSTGTLPATVLNTWQTALGSLSGINVSWCAMRASASPTPASAVLSGCRLRWSLPPTHPLGAGPRRAHAARGGFERLPQALVAARQRAVEDRAGHEHQPEQRHDQQDEHGHDQRESAFVRVHDDSV